MIAYAAINSAVKIGASNMNQASAWTDDSELTYMLLDTDGLGI
jgi:ADP-ribosylglycohydrolase